MSEATATEGEVTVADAIRWLHEEGLGRLSAMGATAVSPAVAYTVQVSTGAVAMFPATNGGIGGDSTILSADDLPPPAEGPGRLVVVGVTTTEAVLVVDLAGSLMISINGDRPELAARSWATQLLLNPEINLTTNSSDIAIGSSPRCRKSFIPGGGGSIISVDDGKPPVTTVSLNATMEVPDYLDIAPDGVGEMYLGPRFWQLSHIMTIADRPWASLVAALDAEDR